MGKEQLNARRDFFYSTGSTMSIIRPITHSGTDGTEPRSLTWYCSPLNSDLLSPLRSSINRSINQSIDQSINQYSFNERRVKKQANIYTVCSKKSDAKIEIIITATNLIRITYHFSSLKYHLSDANVANFNKIHCTVFEQQLFKKRSSKTEVSNMEKSP